MGGMVAVSGFATANAQTAKTVPYESQIAISSSDFDAGWTIIDNNGDMDGTYNVWGPYSDSNSSNPNLFKCAARYYNSSSRTSFANADDYLVSPAIHLEQGKAYRILYNFRAESTSYPKSMKVLAATTNSAEAFQSTSPLKTYEDYKVANYVQETAVFEPTTSGDYYFAFYTDSSNNGWYIFVSTFGVFEDKFAPAAVTNFTAERDAQRELKVNLSWTLPTKSAFGDDFTEGQTVDKVNIYRDGEARPIATLTGAATSFEDNVDTGLEAGIHTYEVEVEVAGALSSKASATTKYVGPVTPEAVPYTWNITDQDAFEDWTSIVGADAVNQSKWAYYSYGPYARFSNTAGQKEENYLLAPPFKITEPGYYLVTVNAMISNISYNADNTLKVCYGTELNAASMKVICDKINFTSSSKTPYSYVVNIPQAGDYYFGVEAASENPKATTFGVYSIGLEATEKTPAAVTNLKATPGEDNALEVTLTWTCPTESSNGESLENSEYQIQVYKGEDLLATLPGGTSSYKDKSITEPGSYTYSVKTIGNNDVTVGAVTVKSSWVGSHLVALPYVTKFSTTDDTVAIWDIVDANADGKTWGYYSNSYRCAQSDIAGEEEGTCQYNDFFLTPHFEMNPGYYALKFQFLGGTAAKPVSMTVGAVEAGSFLAERPVLLQEETYEATTTSSYYAPEITYLFKVETAGTYQFVFAMTGDKYTYSGSDLYSAPGIANVSVASFPVLPGVATDFTAVPAANESLEVTLTWTNPIDTNVEGVELSSIEKAVIIRDGEEIAEVTTDLVPGQESSFVDSEEYDLTSGPHTYSVEIYNADGKSASNGPIAKVDWVGGGLTAPIEHAWAEFEAYWNFIDADQNQVSSYDGWSIAGSTAMKVDETNTNDSFDDWAVTPNINIEKGNIYSITFETYIGASYKQYAPYTLDVYVLNGGSAIDQAIKIGEITTSNENSTANSPETHTLYIKGSDDVSFTSDEAVALVGDDFPEEYTEVPAQTLNIALHAHTKGGVFVKTFSMNLEVTTVIESFENENNSDADAEYYTLQGIKVKNPGKGIFIKVQGDKVTKVAK